MKKQIINFCLILLAVIMLAAKCEIAPPQGDCVDTVYIPLRIDTVYQIDTVCIEPEKPLESECFEIDNQDQMYQVEYVGEWVHMNNPETGQSGSYPRNPTSGQDTIVIRSWLYKFGIRTEMHSGHTGYKVFIDDKLAEIVSVKASTFILDSLTYESDSLPDGNHVIKLVPNNGYFVFNSRYKCIHPIVTNPEVQPSIELTIERAD